MPEACCDAAFLRDVYHHVTDPEPWKRRLQSFRPLQTVEKWPSSNFITKTCAVVFERP